jgi:hypothetical protein
MPTDRRRDLAERLIQGQDAFRRMQQAVARLAMPPEQRAALTDGLTRLMTPGSQFDAIVELLEAFGPPVAQIEAVQKQLVDQRAQLAAMNNELDRIEVAVGRLAAAAETLSANQEMFVKLAGALTGYDPRTRRKTSESSSGRKGTGDAPSSGERATASGGSGAGDRRASRETDRKGGA